MIESLWSIRYIRLLHAVQLAIKKSILNPKILRSLHKIIIPHVCKMKQQKPAEPEDSPIVPVQMCALVHANHPRAQNRECKRAPLGRREEGGYVRPRAIVCRGQTNPQDTQMVRCAYKACCPVRVNNDR